MKLRQSKLLILALLSLAGAPNVHAFEGEGPGETCPQSPRGHRGDHCAHKGQPFRDRGGKICAGGFVSPYDGIHTEEVKVGTLTECFGKPANGTDYLFCVTKYVDAYYRVCPHYKGLF